MSTDRYQGVRWVGANRRPGWAECGFAAIQNVRLGLPKNRRYLFEFLSSSSRRSDSVTY